MSGIARFWTSVSPVVRRTCYVLWCLGTALLFLGVIGDIQKWWTERPFVTNVVSSATTALFGIPIALIFLQRLIYLQNLHHAKAEVVSITRRVRADLHSNVTAICPQGLVDLLQTYNLVRDIFAKFVSDEAESETESWVSMFNLCRSYVLKLTQSLPRREVVQYSLQKLAGTRNYMNNHLRPRFDDVGVEWIDAQLQIDHDDALEKAVESLDELYDLFLIAGGWLSDGLSSEQDFKKHLSEPDWAEHFRRKLLRSSHLLRDWWSFLQLTNDIELQLEERVGAALAGITRISGTD